MAPLEWWVSLNDVSMVTLENATHGAIAFTLTLR